MVRRPGARRSTARLLLTATLTLLLGSGAACTSDDSEDDVEDTGAADEPSRPEPGADVTRPTATGPLTGGEHGQSFNAMPDRVAEQSDYVEEEYILAGEATSYEPDGDLGEDGKWVVSEADTAAYKTRIVVRRPADAEQFDGTVFVEWFNVTAGIDADPDFGFAHPELFRRGSAYVGVSAQRAGVEGGGVAIPIEIPGLEIQPLKQWDPERYGELSHPGDQFSYDIFSQVAQAIRRPGELDILDGLDARHVIAMGESQSAIRMVTYANAVQPVAQIYDGFLIHSRGGGAAPLDDAVSVLGDGTARIRDDLDVPVLQFLTETDLFGVLGFHRARQDDTDTLRTWEVAGTAHADRSLLDYGQDRPEAAGFDLADQCGSINDGPQGEVLRAAIAALRTWVVDGEAPPEAPGLEVDGAVIARDDRGIARGGIRTPAVDAPVSVLTGEAPPGRSVICVLFGDTRPFDAATLADLYPTHQDYVDAVTEATDAAVTGGFLLPADGNRIVAEAEAAELP